jgi:hypothetical protein
MRYANVCDYLHRRQAKRLCEGLPSELLGRNQDIDMVYLLMSQLTYEQSINRFHPLQNFE